MKLTFDKVRQFREWCSKNESALTYQVLDEIEDRYILELLQAWQKFKAESGKE